MASPLDKLHAIARSATAPTSALERQLIAETGLPVVWQAAPDPLRQAIVRNVDASGGGPPRARALAAAFDQHFSEKAFCGNGYRTYRVVQNLLMDGIETAVAADDAGQIDASLAGFEQWWLGDTADPAAAAVYARALTTVGFARARGGRAAPAVQLKDGEAQEALQDLCRRARGVLAGAAHGGREHWLWRQADFGLSFVGWTTGAEDDDALLETFLAVQALDPFEFGIYDDRAVHLLPRWSGSFDEIDDFADAAADQTFNEFGDLLYARIYDAVLAHEDPEATRIDVTRFLKGFDDWYERFPSQALANRHAAQAHAMGEDAILARLCRTVLTEIQPAQWLDLAQPLDAWQAAQKAGRR